MRNPEAFKRGVSPSLFLPPPFIKEGDTGGGFCSIIGITPGIKL
jgi:hypothetical protein